MGANSRTHEMAPSGAATRTLLLACLHQDPARRRAAFVAASMEQRWESLFALAETQGVLYLLYHHIRSFPDPDVVPEVIRQRIGWIRRQIAIRELRRQGELADLLRDLAAAGVPVILLKGAHLANAIYDSITMREMGDFDLLVRREHLERAARVVAARGYVPLRPIAVEADASRKHHVPRFVKRPAAAVEVHWNITRPRQRHSIDPAGLWERAVRIKVAETSAFALSVEDLLLHLCAHVSYQHRFAIGLRPFCDIAETIRRHGHAIDWRAVRQRTEAWQWNRGVYLTLRLAQELLGADVPPAVIASLAPADVNRQVLSATKSLVFAHPSRLDGLGTILSRAARARGFWQSLRLIVDGILFAPEEAQRDPRRWDLRLPMRCGLLVSALVHNRRRGSRVAHLLFRKDRRLAAVFEQQRRLHSWLIAP